VYIFGLHKDIYGKFLEIRFVKLIRPDKKFPSLRALSSQMKKDILACRILLKGRS
jgi:FAD synthase